MKILTINAEDVSLCHLVNSGMKNFVTVTFPIRKSWRSLTTAQS